MGAWPERLRVVGPGFAWCAGLSALLTVMGGIKMGWGVGDALAVWASPVAGPFAGLWFAARWGWGDAIGWAVVCGPLLVAHPLAPGRGTVVASNLGVGFWFLLGLALTYDGV